MGRSPLRILRVAAMAAILAGAAHVLVMGARSLGLGQFIWSSRDVVWMAPAGYLLVFGALSVPLALMAALRPRWMPQGVVVFLFATAAAFSVALLFPRIHHLASLLVAIGIGVRAAQAAGAPDARAARLARTGAVVAAVGLGLVSVGMRATRAWRDDAAWRQLPAAADGAPNVLYIILDTVRARNLSLYGYARATSPNIARIAADGATFDFAFATSSWTLPSHASLMTGVDAKDLSVAWFTPLDDSTPTLAEQMAARGYRTGGFVANHVYTAWESGLARGFHTYEDYRLSLKQVLLSTSLMQTEIASELSAARRWPARWAALRGFNFQVHPAFYSDRKPAADVVDEFLAWEKLGGAHPYFAFLNFFDPHEPYEPPGRFRTMFNGGKHPEDLYDGALAYLDQELGRLADTLRQRGTLDRTVVVIVGDHGEHLGDHGLWGHSNSLYEQLLRVPLVVRYPARVPAGVRVPQSVSLRDLPATVLALADSTAKVGLPGVSLAGAWRGRDFRGSEILAELRVAGRRKVPPGPSRFGDLHAVVRDSLHYIRNGDGSEELYDLQRDAGEQRNLAPGRAAGDSSLAWLRARVSAKTPR
ncbi:MAG: sulfatase [Gemmatimonadaceae bacterium]